MTSLLILAIPVVVLALCRVCYCWGVTAGYAKNTEEQRVRAISIAYKAWQFEMFAERMRQFSPKDVSKN